MYRLALKNFRSLKLGSPSPTKFLTPNQVRWLNDDGKMLIGGGLEKLQGGLKEESYFRTKNYDLMTRIREQGTKLKCEDSMGNWAEFNKVLMSSEEPRGFRDTTSANKHKNCWEEAFFMNQQNECTQIMRVKFNNKSNFEPENSSLTQQQQKVKNIQQQPEPPQQHEANFDIDDSDRIQKTAAVSKI